MSLSFITRLRAMGAAAIAGLLTGASLAVAQDYPTKPVRLIVGFAPGGSNDIIARLLAPKLTELLGAPFVVENRPGANATIATEYVARSAPDGYTLTLASASPLAISPHTYSKIPYDTARDFAGITTVAMTNPTSEAFSKFLQSELVRWGKVAKASGARAD